jgi:Asp-tRNA(Asn)/Glu-tRNA(Gln) amidotransferase B subunit
MVRTNEAELQNMVIALIASHPSEVSAYRSGKVTLMEWFLGQAMRQTHGRADPTQMRELIQRYLDNPDEK